MDKIEVTAKCAVCREAIVPRPGAMCGLCYQKSVAESEDQARRIGLRKSATVEEIARELNGEVTGEVNNEDEDV